MRILLQDSQTLGAVERSVVVQVVFRDHVLQPEVLESVALCLEIVLKILDAILRLQDLVYESHFWARTILAPVLEGIHAFVVNNSVPFLRAPQGPRSFPLGPLHGEKDWHPPGRSPVGGLRQIGLPWRCEDKEVARRQRVLAPGLDTKSAASVARRQLAKIGSGECLLHSLVQRCHGGTRLHAARTCHVGPPSPPFELQVHGRRES
mmetsp:Transcript_26760/g.50326  ORF Transcript_26760/g.50326 Transcript_26760/m.50326 type:complete len:206 (+) Transcript_26760:367-984(+)